MATMLLRFYLVMFALSFFALTVFRVVLRSGDVKGVVEDAGASLFLCAFGSVLATIGVYVAVKLRNSETKEIDKDPQG